MQGTMAPHVEVLLEGFGINTSAGRIAMCQVTLIEGSGPNGEPVRILVDPAHAGRRTVLVEALASRGLTPADIDLVVLTHAHWDHVQNVDVFAHAPVCLHPRERRYSEGPHPNDWATPAWTGAILERMQLREVAEGDELIPGVTVVDLPGHSPGSIGLTVQNPDGLSVITGDAVHRAAVALSRQSPLVFWSAADARASIDRVVRMADVIYPGHDQAFRLTSAGEVEYVRPFRLTITGTAADRPGLSFDAKMPDPWVMPGIEEQPGRLARPASPA